MNENTIVVVNEKKKELQELSLNELWGAWLKDNIKDFWEQLYERAEKEDLSLKELKAMVGCSSSYIYAKNKKNGDSIPNAMFVLKIARVFNVPIDDLFLKKTKYDEYFPKWQKLKTKDDKDVKLFDNIKAPVYTFSTQEERKQFVMRYISTIGSLSEETNYKSLVTALLPFLTNDQAVAIINHINSYLPKGER